MTLDFEECLIYKTHFLLHTVYTVLTAIFQVNMVL